jgi:hypothetical protein
MRALSAPLQLAIKDLEAEELETRKFYSEVDRRINLQEVRGGLARASGTHRVVTSPHVESQPHRGLALVDMMTLAGTHCGMER